MNKLSSMKYHTLVTKMISNLTRKRNKITFHQQCPRITALKNSLKKTCKEKPQIDLFNIGMKLRMQKVFRKTLASQNLLKQLLAKMKLRRTTKIQFIKK